jgi:site-specific DNA-adenine methylase
MQWIGGKARLSSQLRAALNVEHTVMVEPFLGGGGLFLNRCVLNSRHIINDLDEGLYSFWKVIGSNRYGEFVYKFSNFPISRELFEVFKAIRGNGYTGCDDMKKALITYYLVVYSFNGNMKHLIYNKKPDLWDKVKTKQISRLKDNIYRAHLQASNVDIYNTDARVVIAAYKDNSDALIYIDSPYVYELMGDRKDLYGEVFGNKDQVEMLELIQDSKAKVCISGYRGKSLLYDRYLNRDTGWHTYKLGCVTRSAGTFHAKKNNKHNKADEFIWTNYEVPKEAVYEFNTFDFSLDYADIEEYLSNGYQ